MVATTTAGITAGSEVPKYSYLNVIDSLNQALSSYKYSMGTCSGNAISAECLNMRNALMISTTQLYSAE